MSLLSRVVNLKVSRVLPDILLSLYIRIQGCSVYLVNVINLLLIVACTLFSDEDDV